MELDVDSQPIAYGGQYSANCPPKTPTPPPYQRHLSYLGPSSWLLAPADEHVDSGAILHASMSNIPLDRSLPEVNCFSDGVFGPVLNTEVMPSSETRRPKRGPFQDATLRMETADMRKIGSCIRCKTQRIRCRSNPEDPSGECLPCGNMAGSSLHRFPCMRHKLTQLRLIKPAYIRGDDRVTRSTSMAMDPIKAWATHHYKLVRISEGLSNKYMELGVRELTTATQGNDDCRGPSVSIGVNEYSSNIRTYSLADPRAGEEAYADYIPKITGHALRRFSGPPKGLLHQTYRLACQVYQDPTTPAESAELLRVAFRLWTSVRLLAMPSFIIGEETLGLDYNLEEDSRVITPVPADLGAQLELTLRHYIEGTLRKDLIGRLQSMMNKDRKGTWLVIYLVTFMLLHNTTLLIGHGAHSPPEPGVQVRSTSTLHIKMANMAVSLTLFAWQPFDSTENVKELYHGKFLRSPCPWIALKLALEAHTLLAHFHYCNRGLFPLSEDCRDQVLAADVGLDDEKVQFIHNCRTFARQHSMSLVEDELSHSFFSADNDQSVVVCTLTVLSTVERHWDELETLASYEDDYFFISQMFERNWQPRPVPTS
ncbi:hypothetical protein PCL_12096 [Purpureocillium lilacinum]|uniref:Zn(2)-C6 fungal-type domain-containing protein n=1 Tax=Purpureocillium lilacinum TaxID=33203 RepID=A0A2U3DPH4_PURLI|nr:hypothetical protein PCL_12096 [Purpureocillium lilacinum]